MIMSLRFHHLGLDVACTSAMAGKIIEKHDSIISFASNIMEQVIDFIHSLGCSYEEKMDTDGNPGDPMAWHDRQEHLHKYLEKIEAELINFKSRLYCDLGHEVKCVSVIRKIMEVHDEIFALASNTIDLVRNTYFRPPFPTCTSFQ